MPWKQRMTKEQRLPLQDKLKRHPSWIRWGKDFVHRMIYGCGVLCLVNSAPENITSVHGRGIHVIRELMDEVHFVESGAVIHMRKSATEGQKLVAKDTHENYEN